MCACAWGGVRVCICAGLLGCVRACLCVRACVPVSVCVCVCVCDTCTRARSVRSSVGNENWFRLKLNIRPTTYFLKHLDHDFVFWEVGSRLSLFEAGLLTYK